MIHTNAKNDLTLEIDALSYGPYGIGRADGKAVMVPSTAPGDAVVATIVESKDRYAVGTLVRLLRPSALRQIPPCPYVNECGGCSWQHLSYDAQLRAKEQSVGDALRRIGKLERFELRPIIASPEPYHYRRRIRLQRHAGEIGFYRPFSHDLVAIDRCLIADENLNRAIAPLRRWVSEISTPIEHVEAVTGEGSEETVAVAETASDFVPSDGRACEALVNGSAVRGLILRSRGRRRTWGCTTLSLETEPDLTLRIEADVFLQVNAQGNRRLIRELLNIGEFADQHRVLELYCGAGNFTLPIARRVRQVMAVEGYRRSIDGGIGCAERNRIGNIDWVCAPVPDTVARLKKRGESFSRIVLDPPRAGAKGIAPDLALLRADKILYVSCNPTTLARDVAALAQYGYTLETVQPIDLFPHTFHVEAIAVLRR
jgi:23S rRNA (uracil1939-C5)-methyltransferase